jgi:hypothetical protein
MPKIATAADQQTRAEAERLLGYAFPGDSRVEVTGDIGPSVFGAVVFVDGQKLSITVLDQRRRSSWWPPVFGTPDFGVSNMALTSNTDVVRDGDTPTTGR